MQLEGVLSGPVVPAELHLSNQLPGPRRATHTEAVTDGASLSGQRLLALVDRAVDWEARRPSLDRWRLRQALEAWLVDEVVPDGRGCSTSMDLTVAVSGDAVAHVDGWLAVRCTGVIDDEES